MSYSRVLKVIFISIFLFGTLIFWIWSELFLVTIILLLAFDFTFTHVLVNQGKAFLNKFFFNFFKSLLFLAGIFLFAIFIRVFAVEIFIIPSSSMEKTLLPGDLVFTEKLNYGPLLPNNLTEIPYGSLFFDEDSVISYRVKKLKGIGEINRNDIIVFKKNNTGKTMIKRIVGLPNETFKIVDSKVIVNNSSVKELEDFVFEYRLKKDSTVALSNKDILLSGNGIKLDRVIKPPKSVVEGIFPPQKMYYWNIDNYGSIWIPKKGHEILLNKENYFFFKEILENETGKKLITNNEIDMFYLGGTKIKKYKFRFNYYFVMGDNRNFSRDSRFYGLINENNILGKFFGKI